MSESSAPPVHTNLDSSNNSNNNNNNNNKPKTMKQFEEDDAALEREQKDIEEQIRPGNQASSMPFLIQQMICFIRVNIRMLCCYVRCRSRS
jgi:hypothetical protein